MVKKSAQHMVPFFVLFLVFLGLKALAAEKAAPFMGAVIEPSTAPIASEVKTPADKPAQTSPSHVQLQDADYYKRYGKRHDTWDIYAIGGLNAFEAGNDATGLVLLRTAYEKGCRDPLVLLRLALYFELKDNFKDAEKLIDYAVKNFTSLYGRHPEKNDITAHAARIYYAQGKYDEALPLFEQALRTNPKNVEAMLMSGQILREQKKYQEAKRRFEQGIAETAKVASNTDLHYAFLRELLVTSYLLEDYPSTLHAAKQILELNPNDELAQKYQNKIKRDQQMKKDDEVLFDLVK